MSSRRAALEALHEWENTSSYAEDILADVAGHYKLTGPNRALAVEILYGTIRNLYLLDEIIDELRRGSIKPETQNLLRIGLFQIFLSGIADHAAVNETVNLSRKHERGLVNAILRNALRRREEFEAAIASWPLEDRYSHPQFLIDRWEAQHGKEAAAAFCEWNNQPPTNFARLNRLAADQEGLKRVESEIEPCLIGESHPDFFNFEGAPDRDWIDEGLIYVQDPSTSLSCRLLDPKPGERILDACGAPGGKAAYLAALSGDPSELTVTDSSEKRLTRTRDNLERLGAGDAHLQKVDWNSSSLSADDFEPFDAILLDVPCSNSGVIRRRVDVRWRLQPDDFGRQAAVQKELLKNTIPFLKPGGRIVYSTCSIDQEENEQVIEASGLQIEKTISSLPWRDQFDGAFAALLRR
ncbi:MAG: 16S rRNA (cytosine(967)-C(5))-methyltransferase RsmB [Verrucomicrobiales bacterium]|nr:16S rRNA (cytosine(967)-C(5))-methyltransferase RsmB [Verrucomicrobiales bacterium]